MCQGIQEDGLDGMLNVAVYYWAKHLLFNVVLTMLIFQVKTPGDGRYRTHRDSTPQVANISNLSPGGPVVKV